MATEQPHPAINGGYVPQQAQPYSAAEQLSSHGPSHVSQNPSAAPAHATDAFGSQGANVPNNSNAGAQQGQGNTAIPKEEVGWYFVEQYYTTLSRSPEKLHLFYSKRSQFVSGVEAEKVPVAVGQRAISERIKELDIQDCKVRVSNVDSQSSFQNIVVQVIGEISNKSEPHRKFVQTFVLAEQPNGYFVLNDMFRYINDEEEVFEGEAANVEEAATSGYHEEPPTKAEPTETLPSTADGAEQAPVVDEVARKLEDELRAGHAEGGVVAEIPATNGVSASAAEPTEPAVAGEAPVAAVGGEEEAKAVTPEAAESAVAAEAVQPEKPQDPEPTRAATPQQATSQTAPAPAPAKPAAPKTWANLVAANATNAANAAKNVVAAAIPSVAQSATPAPQSKPSPTTSQAPAASSTPTTESAQTVEQQEANAGWQTAGEQHAKRQNRPQSVSAGEGQRIQAYVKNVTQNVDANQLKSTLQKYGELAYFDVSRQKNCAFVEFATQAGYDAAVAANPHLLGGEQVYVEERRIRGAYPGNFQSGRGGRGGRPGSQGRGGFNKDSGRGGYTPRGRGGSTTPRGRGGNQAA